MTPAQKHNKSLQLLRLRESIRMKNYSDSTNESYCRYVGKYIDFICDSPLKRWHPPTLKLRNQMASPDQNSAPKDVMAG